MKIAIINASQREKNSSGIVNYAIEKFDKNIFEIFHLKNIKINYCTFTE